jgi:uncharacterized protein (TIGR03435 family)
MINRIAQMLDLRRKLLLAATGVAAVIGPVVIGVLNTPQVQAQSQPARPLEFDVASIKPNKSGDGRMAIQPLAGGRFNARNITLEILMRNAYRVQGFQITGGPDWVRSQRYDVEAKAEGNPSMAQIQIMIQRLLADRFHLAIRRETKTSPLYALVINKNGIKFRMSGDAQCPEGAGPLCGGFKASPGGEILGERVTMEQFAQVLTLMMGQRVINNTGLDGVADVQLRWTPDETILRGPGDPDAPPPDPNGPSISDALQDQLGLKLDHTQGPVEILVIDHVEKPSEN